MKQLYVNLIMYAIMKRKKKKSKKVCVVGMEYILFSMGSFYEDKWSCFMLFPRQENLNVIKALGHSHTLPTKHKHAFDA